MVTKMGGSRGEARPGPARPGPLGAPRVPGEHEAGQPPFLTLLSGSFCQLLRSSLQQQAPAPSNTPGGRPAKTPARDSPGRRCPEPTQPRCPPAAPTRTPAHPFSPVGLAPRQLQQDRAAFHPQRAGQGCTNAARGVTSCGQRPAETREGNRRGQRTDGSSGSSGSSGRRRKTRRSRSTFRATLHAWDAPSRERG